MYNASAYDDVVVATVVVTVNMATVLVEVTPGADVVTTGAGNFDEQKVCASGRLATAEATTPITPLQVAADTTFESVKRSVLILRTFREKTIAKGIDRGEWVLKTQ